MYPPSTQLYPYLLFLSFQVYFLLFSHSVVFDSLQSRGLQQARLPCPLPTPRGCSNSCPLSQWCHPTIFISVAPFSCLLSFLASGSFLVSWLFTSDDQCIGASAMLILFVEMVLAITCSSSWVYQNSRSGDEGKKRQPYLHTPQHEGKDRRERTSPFMSTSHVTSRFWNSKWIKLYKEWIRIIWKIDWFQVYSSLKQSQL